jgi:hypothetical protein
LGKREGYERLASRYRRYRWGQVSCCSWDDEGGSVRYVGPRRGELDGIEEGDRLWRDDDAMRVCIDFEFPTRRSQDLPV